MLDGESLSCRQSLCRDGVIVGRGTENKSVWSPERQGRSKISTKRLST